MSDIWKDFHLLANTKAPPKPNALNQTSRAMALHSQNNCSAPASGVKPAEVDHFSNLPQELRSMIWSLIIEPRIIEVRYKIQHDGEPFYKYVSRIPVLLHVDRNSRTEGLRYYELSKAGPTMSNRFYFNIALDTIDISRTFNTEFDHQRWFLHINECGFFERVQRMLIARTSFVHLPELREVTLVGQLICSERWPCYCTTRIVVDYATLKTELKRRGGLIWKAEQSEAIGASEAPQFIAKWKKQRGNLPCPVVKLGAVCGKPPGEPDVLVSLGVM